jgi:hypothetical protein
LSAAAALILVPDPSLLWLPVCCIFYRLAWKQRLPLCGQQSHVALLLLLRQQASSNLALATALLQPAAAPLLLLAALGLSCWLK